MQIYQLYCYLNQINLTRYIWLKIWISSRLSSYYKRIYKSRTWSANPIGRVCISLGERSIIILYIINEVDNQKKYYETSHIIVLCRYLFFCFFFSFSMVDFLYQFSFSIYFLFNLHQFYFSNDWSLYFYLKPLQKIMNLFFCAHLKYFSPY